MVEPTFPSMMSLLREIVWTHTMLRKIVPSNPWGLRMPSTATRLASARQRLGLVPQPHALSDRSLSFLVRQAHRAFVATLADRLLPHGVSVAEWAVLRRLWQEEGFTQVDLADRMRVRKASLTSVLASLERKGLLRRIRRGEDRRKCHLFLTRRGRDLKEELLPIGVAINRKAVAGIDPDDAGLAVRLLEMVIANLEGR
jgi:DNA-binding MarR family transcriptional regulator